MNTDDQRPFARFGLGASGSQGGIVTPFMRLARLHAMSAAADGAIAATLAGSIFFSISPEESRGRVALALLLTMAPFAVVTPLIGPAIDRIHGGRRMMIIVTTVGRAVLALLIIQHVDTLLLFPEIFGVLVLQKGYSVAKSAVVPRFVDSDEDLVGANSRLALISAISGPIGAGLAGLFSIVGGPAAAAAVGLVGFVLATVLALRIPSVIVASAPAEQSERAELRDRKILLAATSMMIVRGIVGFVTMLLMFELRGGKDGLDVSTEGAALGGATATVRDIDITGDPRAPVWHFAVVGLFAVAGTLGGVRFAPAFRRRLTEEQILLGAITVLVSGALFGALSGGLFGTVILAATVTAAAGTGKLAFDALVQRDTVVSNYGRSFARFEARFQLAFATGAMLPVVIRLSIPVGAGLVGAVGGVALLVYVFGNPGRLFRLPRLSRAKPPSSARPVGLSDDALADDALADDALADDALDFDEELRPSQPAPPAGTSDYSQPKTWDQSTPYVSSIDGVEVDPIPPSGSRAEPDDTPSR